MRFLVRVDPIEPLPETGTIVLDWFAQDRPRSTVQFDSPDHRFLAGLSPSPAALDLLRLGGAVFCVDKIARRGDAADFWTRDLALTLPVSDPALWRAASELVEGTLSFLSGDRWSVSFSAATGDQEAEEAEDEEEQGTGTVVAADAVSLFSGGLDSLAGAIELLEAGETLLLVGHHDSALTDHTQTELFKGISAAFPDRAIQRRLLLRPGARDPRQARPLPAGEGEITTRTRSLLFLSAGIALADALGSGTPLYVPENGFIGLNVPLTAARVGSLSTRTTHPLFMQRIAELLSALGLDHSLVNPFRLATKGEALERSPRRDILDRLALASISCSHPEAARWHSGRQGNCGYCYPCMIRRASLHRIGLDDAGEYDRDALTDAPLLQRTGLKVGRDLRALLSRMAVAPKPVDVLRNGPIPGGETRAFFDLYLRGLDELRSWLTDGGSPEIVKRLG